eukprot:gene15658-21764_t
MSGASGSTAPGSPYKLRKSCVECGLEEGGGKKLKKCKSCQGASYCGKECQKADWPRHKPNPGHNAPMLTALLTLHPCFHVLTRSNFTYANSPGHNAPMLTALVQHYTVMPVDVASVEFPANATTIQGAMHKLKMCHQQAKYAYGLIVITCSNDLMVPTVCKPLCSPDREIPHHAADHILRLINGEP